MSIYNILTIFSTSMIILFLIFYLFLFSTHSSAFDLRIANTSVWLSGAAYCGNDNYDNMIIGGTAKGFVYFDTLYDIATDLQGFVGILPSTREIYVSLRGSSSAMNWLDDFEVKLVPYTTFPECNCQVHNGFYRSIKGIRERAIASVNALKKVYPLYSVVITGHSYGASTCQLLAMEFIAANITYDLKIYNFGQPRVGDKIYSEFVNQHIGNNYYRFTHNRDIVPHVPPIKEFNYYHSCGEIFEEANGNLRECSCIDCEDSTCADQYKLWQTTGDDHSIYLGHELSCESSTL